MVKTPDAQSFHFLQGMALFLSIGYVAIQGIDAEGAFKDIAAISWSDPSTTFEHKVGHAGAISGVSSCVLNGSVSRGCLSFSGELSLMPKYHLSLVSVSLCLTH